MDIQTAISIVGILLVILSGYILGWVATEDEVKEERQNYTSYNGKEG